MKPLNADSASCTPISSNCVIWQGPDIPCIKLCKGDTVSAVVYKLALELCTIMAQTDITNYDLACLNIQGCGPKDLAGLIQILIDRICALEGCCSGTTPTPTTGCQDCVVNIAPCFYYTNELGDTITTMQLNDYVLAIGNRVCSILDQITIINAILNNHEIRITALENAPPPTFTLPKVTPVCVLPSVATDMNLVLSALESQFCTLLTATGTATNIFDAILFQCPGLNSAPRLGGPGTMSSITGWVNTVQNLSDSIKNLWLTICDLRAAVVNIQVNCCPQACDGVDITITASLTGSTLTIFPTGTIPTGFTQCAPSFLTSFTVSDESGNSIVLTGDIIGNLNSSIVFNLGATPINILDNLTVTAPVCLTKDGNVCSYNFTYYIANSGSCPTMTYTETDTTIAYNGLVTLSGTATYVVELWDSTGSTLISSQSTLVTVPPATSISGTFNTLTASTVYKLRVRVSSGGSTIFTCPFATVVTLAPACPPPTDVVPTITIP